MMETMEMYTKENIRMDEIVSLLEQYSLPPTAVAAIIGNIDVETGGTFDYKQKQKNGNGYGLFQFDFMKPYYFDWLKENKKKDSAAAQVEFMYDSIYGANQSLLGNKNAEELRKSLENDDVNAATYKFMTIFEKPGVPHTGRRLSSAQNAMQMLGTQTEENKEKGVRVEMFTADQAPPMEEDTTQSRGFVDMLKGLLR